MLRVFLAAAQAASNRIAQKKGGCLEVELPRVADLWKRVWLGRRGHCESSTFQGERGWLAWCSVGVRLGFYRAEALRRRSMIASPSFVSGTGLAMIRSNSAASSRRIAAKRLAAASVRDPSAERNSTLQYGDKLSISLSSRSVSSPIRSSCTGEIGSAEITKGVLGA